MLFLKMKERKRASWSFALKLLIPLAILMLVAGCTEKLNLTVNNQRSFAVTVAIVSVDYLKKPYVRVLGSVAPQSTGMFRRALDKAQIEHIQITDSQQHVLKYQRANAYSLDPVQIVVH